MKTKQILLLLLFISIGAVAQDIYYYYKGEKVDLKIDQNYLNIVMNDDTGLSSAKDLLDNSSCLKTINILKKNSNIKLISPDEKD